MISKHVSDKESVYSRTAQRLNIDNTPSEDHKENMVELAENIFEPLRSYVGGPIKINSFYRSPKLNRAIGGSSRSQHCNGQAVDVDDTFGKASNAEMYEFIKIWEFGTDKNPDWVHVSYVSPQQNRNRCLKAYKKDGKTKYMVI